jgi:hypothetical protein
MSRAPLGISNLKFNVIKFFFEFHVKKKF